MDTLETLLAAIRQREEVRDALLSVLVILFFWVLRRGLLRMVKSARSGSERDHVRWSAQVRRGTVALAALSLTNVTAELRTMALGFLALGVAAVIATKELILCVMGSFLRASSRSFSLGDRVEIGSVRGDVIDHGLFATTVLEIGPGHEWTGRSLTIPNSVLLSEPVINETFTDAFVLHVISVPLAQAADATAAEALLIDCAKEACADYLEQARVHLSRKIGLLGLNPPDVEPRVFFTIPEVDSVQLLLRLPTPAHSKGVIEQRVLKSFIARRAE